MDQNPVNYAIYTPEQLRKAEDVAMGQCTIPQVLLMEHAAMAVANAVCEDAKDRDFQSLYVAVLAGNGNNGADALAVGRLLVRKGINVTVYELENNPERTAGRQRTWVYQYQTNNNAYGEQRSWLMGYEIEESYDMPFGAVKFDILAPEIDWSRFDYVIDGMFGIGLVGSLIGVIRDTINSLNNYTYKARLTSGKRPTVVAIDIPSGIDAMTGEILGAAVYADITVTFSGVKIGQMIYPGREYCGRRITAEIGIPPSALQDAYGCVMMRPWKMIRRDPAGHKGTFGKVLIVAGSETTPGAAVLAAKACYRSGAGMVKVVSTENVLAELLHELPEAVLCTREQWLADPEGQAAGYNVAVVGPGLGVSVDTLELMYSVLNIRRLIHVLDADALNLICTQLQNTDLFARINELMSIVGEQCIFTPHPQELARLLGWTAEEVKKNRFLLVNRWHDVEIWKKIKDVVLVAKDATTIVVGNKATYFNETGNDGMGTAGSGDVLAGICGAIAIDACNGYRTLDQCAAQAVALHGLAGDIAAEKFGHAGMKAGDIIEAIPDAIREAGTTE